MRLPGSWPRRALAWSWPLLVRLERAPCALFLSSSVGVHRVAHVVVALVKRADLDLLVLRLRPSARAARSAARGRRRRHDDEGLDKEGGDIEPKGHARVRSRRVSGARVPWMGGGWQDGRAGRGPGALKSGLSDPGETALFPEIDADAPSVIAPCAEIIRHHLHIEASGNNPGLEVQRPTGLRPSRKIVSSVHKKPLRLGAISPNSALAQYARACGRVSVGGDLDKRPVNRPWKTGSRRRTGEPRPTGDAT